MRHMQQYMAMPGIGLAISWLEIMKTGSGPKDYPEDISCMETKLRWLEMGDIYWNKGDDDRFSQPFQWLQMRRKELGGES